MRLSPDSWIIPLFGEPEAEIRVTELPAPGGQADPVCHHPPRPPVMVKSLPVRCPHRLLTSSVANGSIWPRGHLRWPTCDPELRGTICAGRDHHHAGTHGGPRINVVLEGFGINTSAGLVAMCEVILIEGAGPTGKPDGAGSRTALRMAALAGVFDDFCCHWRVSELAR